MTNKTIELGADATVVEKLFRDIDIRYYNDLAVFSTDVEKLMEILQTEKGNISLQISTSNHPGVETVLKLTGPIEIIEYSIRSTPHQRGFTKTYNVFPRQTVNTSCNFSQARKILKQISKFIRKYPKFNIIDFINSIK